MTEASYEYDVAFSFLAQDEALAERLHNIVSASLKSFLYSKRQGEIVGTDAEVTLNRVYGERARVVVVLYRKTWGETPFTRIEQTAIQNRAFTKGYDFVLMIPLDSPPTVPPWIPKPRIWYDLGRFGETPAAAIIEERVRQAGGEPQVETPEQSLHRLAADDRAEGQRLAMLQMNGVRNAQAEVEKLFSEIERIAAASTSEGYAVETERHPHGQLSLFVRAGGITARLDWANPYGNTLDESGLHLAIFGASLRFAGQYFTEPRRLQETRYAFDLTRGLQPIWRRARNTDSPMSTTELAADVLRVLTNRIRQERRL